MHEFEEEQELGSSVTVAGEDELGEHAGADLGLGPGARIGRYVVLNVVGAGGMGIVLAAYDPHLDRRVALKLLRPRGARGHAETRLQREAQALAKLDHPNVVSVHDVGVHGDRVFVAMDFVAGHTLASWLRARKRTWQAILDVFIEAGRGLAAAHAAGLVHRDFKPDNVMIDERASRRVRVMDFGLARADSASPSEHDGSAEFPTPPAIDARLTQTGALIGTPAYMALEQFQGREVDARSDQFAFCVALYEALYGLRPFPSREVHELIGALEAEQIREPPSSAQVPSWVRRVVVRGLAANPARRWPSMQALLDALADDPAPRRRRGLSLAVLASLLATATAAIVVMQDEAAPSVCAGARLELEGAWDASRRAAVEQAFTASELGYASATLQRVVAGLDAYASDWASAHTDACEATEAGVQSGELLDLRMACLAERRTSLAALVDELAHADATVIERAVAAVLDLPTLARCSDPEALRTELPPPEDPELARAVARLEQQRLAAIAKHAAGRFDDAAGLLDTLLREAEPLGYEPLLARVWLQQGDTSIARGRYEDALGQLERALETAVGHRMHDVAAHAAATLVYLDSYELSELARARARQPLAAALARAAGSDEILAIYETDAGALEIAAGNTSTAAAHYERALALRHGTLGPDHPDVGSSLTNLGNAEHALGKLDDAQGHMQAALDLQIRVLGPEHPGVATMHNNLGALAISQDRLDEARRHLEAALTIWQRSLGPDHPLLAYPLGNLGVLATDQGRFDEAHAHLQRALKIGQRSLGPDHPFVADTLDQLGELALAQGDPALARSHFERALAMRERVQGREHPELAYSLTGLGRARLAAGEPTLARPLLERSLALYEGDGEGLADRGTTRFALARTLAALPEPELGRARELAEQARADFAREGAASVEIEPIDAWLATLPRP